MKNPSKETAYTLECESCGKTGQLFITQGPLDWSFAPVGFLGIAVNRQDPNDSVLQCIECGSGRVRVDTGRRK
jgi:Zn finger protein HypA/HybF involved in hydrogenase expression